MIKFTLRQSHWHISTDAREWKRILREYYELYANELKNLDEMNKFLEAHK